MADLRNLQAWVWLKSFLVWALCLCLLPLVLYLWKLAEIEEFLLVPFFALLETLALWFVGLRLDLRRFGVLAGVLLGFLLPIAASLIAYWRYHGFESAPILWLGFLSAGPSAVGGALAGWIASRSGNRYTQAQAADSIFSSILKLIAACYRPFGKRRSEQQSNSMVWCFWMRERHGQPPEAQPNENRGIENG